MLLDTSFLVDLIRRDAGAHAKWRELDDSSSVPFLPAPVIYELWEGIRRSRKPPQSEEGLRTLLDGLPILGLTGHHARRAGLLSGDLILRGLETGDIDLLLAGMALEEGMPIVTRDLGDFSRIEGLELITY